MNHPKTTACQISRSKLLNLLTYQQSHSYKLKLSGGTLVFLVIKHQTGEDLMAETTSAEWQCTSVVYCPMILLDPRSNDAVHNTMKSVTRQAEQLGMSCTYLVSINHLNIHLYIWLGRGGGAVISWWQSLGLSFSLWREQILKKYGEQLMQKSLYWRWWTEKHM